MTSCSPSPALQQRLAAAIESGRFSLAGLHATYVSAAASGEPFDVVLARALDHAEQGAAMLSWQTHKAWQPPPVDAEVPAWRRAPVIADDAQDLAIARGIAAMTTAGRARFRSQGMSEAEVDALAEAIISTPEGRRQASAVSYVTRATRPTSTARTSTTPPAAATPTGEPHTMDDATRRRAIGDLLLPGHEALIAECQADPTCSPSDAALRIARAERARRAAAAVSPSAASRGPANLAAIAESARAEFAASADLQAEFGTVDRFISYRQGVADGRIRIAGGRASGAQAARSFVASPAPANGLIRCL